MGHWPSILDPLWCGQKLLPGYSVCVGAEGTRRNQVNANMLPVAVSHGVRDKRDIQGDEGTGEKSGPGSHCLSFTLSKAHQQKWAWTPKSWPSHSTKGKGSTSTKVLPTTIFSKQAYNAFLSTSENARIRVQTKHFLPGLVTPVADFSTMNMKVIQFHGLKGPRIIYSY